MKFLQDVLLSLHTTFKTGGPAAFFCEVEDEKDLREALYFAQQRGRPFFILGEGSNTLASDEGFDGLIIKIKIKGVKWSQTNDGVEMVMGAGENWDEMVALAVEKGFSGLEHLSGIPGTVGAAPVQNIGAYGKEIKDTLSWVEVFDIEKMEVLKILASECDFGYRDSVFKRKKGGFVIMRVACNLSQKKESDISYKDLTNFFKEKNISPSASEVRKAVLAIRREKLPDLSVYGTAGSFFKNPIVSNDFYEHLRKTFNQMPCFDVSVGKKKIPAAWILDNVCHYKGYRVGDAGVYKNQPLVLVNYGNSTTKDILNVADEMCACVKKNTEIDLEKEVVILN